MSERNTNLKQNFDDAVDAYVKELLAMWSDYDTEDPAFTPNYGYWVGDDKSGVYCYGDDTFINLPDLIFCVGHHVKYDTFRRWHDYCVEAAEWGFDIPNLKSWVAGCPRVPDETFEKLRGRKEQLEDLVEIVKNNPDIQI